MSILQLKTDTIDSIPNTQKYQARTELGRRLLAHTCEWCGTQQGQEEKLRENWRAAYTETCTDGSEGRAVKPDAAMY
jgi:hypothetical protein